MRLPAGYEHVRVGGARGFAWSGTAEWLEAVLRNGTVLGWAASLGHQAFTGRGRTLAVSAPRTENADPGGEWVVRHYRRGGLIAALMTDRYLRIGPERPLRELRASVRARERGVRTPRIMAGAVYPSGPVYRADLVTERVPDAITLADGVFGAERGTAIGGPLRAAGQLVGLLEREYVVHRDMNAHNVLLVDTDPTVAHVIDLDGCRALPVGSRRPVGVMRRRLERSLRKLETAHDRPLPETAWEALRAGYEEPA